MSGRQRRDKVTVADCINSAANIGSGKTARIADNRRQHDRHSYKSDVPIVWLGPVHRSESVGVIHASDISVGGVRLIGKHMLYPGTFGVVQLTRTDGSLALVGVIVMHTCYIGAMRYASGCRFMPVPEEHMSRFVRNGELVRLVPGGPLPGSSPDQRAA